MDFEPTGAVVTEVNPGFPGLAHGLVQPGDVLAVMVDEWKQPSDYFVRHAPFSAIERAAFEVRHVPGPGAYRPTCTLDGRPATVRQDRLTPTSGTFSSGGRF